MDKKQSGVKKSVTFSDTFIDTLKPGSADNTSSISNVTTSVVTYEDSLSLVGSGTPKQSSLPLAHLSAEKQYQLINVLKFARRRHLKDSELIEKKDIRIKELQKSVWSLQQYISLLPCKEELDDYMHQCQCQKDTIDFLESRVRLLEQEVCQQSNTIFSLQQANSDLENQNYQKTHSVNRLEKYNDNLIQASGSCQVYDQLAESFKKLENEYSTLQNKFLAEKALLLQAQDKIANLDKESEVLASKMKEFQLNAELTLDELNKLKLDLSETLSNKKLMEEKLNANLAKIEALETSENEYKIIISSCIKVTVNSDQLIKALLAIKNGSIPEIDGLIYQGSLNEYEFSDLLQIKEFIARLDNELALLNKKMVDLCAELMVNEALQRKLVF